MRKRAGVQGHARSGVLDMVTVLILPATIGPSLLATPVVTFLFGQSATGRADVDIIVLALIGY